jgi:hypothetical protein
MKVEASPAMNSSLVSIDEENLKGAHLILAAPILFGVAFHRLSTARDLRSLAKAERNTAGTL